MSTVGDRNAPLSPVSVGGSDWSFSKYQGLDDGPYSNNRGNIVSPPHSGGSPGIMSMNGFPSGPKSTGGPSPPPSVGRSSNGTGMYARSDGGRNSAAAANAMDDGILNEHYLTLRSFLMARDPNVKQQPNKARDKLLRLSPVQFYELSTDVYDELMRRQAMARTPPNAPSVPPSYLLPEKSFHPKRNQARQRLSSLGPPRFRDLAADVFHELERRYPQFMGGDIPRVGSAVSMRGGPMNRNGTPVNGNGFPIRGQSRMRRPSDASSIRTGMPPIDPYSIPPSPSVPNGDYGRPMPRPPNQNNTIVPNKSTMVEEDDDGSDAFGLENATNGTGTRSEADKKLIENHESQVRELREKIQGMEDAMKKKEEEMNSALEGERSRISATESEKQEWADLRSDLEDQLAEAQSLNSSLKQELEQMHEEHQRETSHLQDQVEQSREVSSESANENLQRENEQLRQSLQQQQEVTEGVRTEAQEFLREMRVLSEQSNTAYEKHAELEKTVDQLEHELREWRNRYARAKTQVRSLRGSTTGLAIGESALAKHVRDKGFTDDYGIVKDIHVTKFQMAIDELLQKTRHEDPGSVIDGMKSVVVSVRRITRDLDESTPHGNEPIPQQGKLKAKVSATANSLITASKNFAASAGISPVSLVDAAASNLSVAIVDLLRAVKIRPTPAGELEEEEEGAETPVESTGFFSPRSTTRGSATPQEGLPPPPPFQGLGGGGSARVSAESSAYSPAVSPRASVNAYTNGVTNGAGFRDAANGYGMQHNDGQLEDLKIYLEDQNALLVSDIQNLVNCIRADANVGEISDQICSINDIVGKILSEMENSGHGDMVGRVNDCRDRLLEANERGQELADSGVNEKEWRIWTQTLPPIAFEIARETKELVLRIGKLATSHDADDFS